MKVKSHTLALVAITASAIVPTTASADGPADSRSQDRTVLCGKDYSRNGATGDYCLTSSNSAAIVPPAEVVDEGFSWSDAGIGAGGALLIVGVAGASTVVLRRRRVGTGQPAVQSGAS